ncbi:MAG: T9SS type A sorting domain-containing protein [Candidatus Marinimicrobia bacterium]|nr:T9SS type A sorting domain-containing protein [Candidatus Neomarinimicrobiota bacterium]
MKSITRILSFTLLWLIVPSVVMAVDLNNYSLSFSENENGVITLDTWPSSTVTHETEFSVEAWVKLAPGATDGLIISKEESFALSIENSKLTFNMYMEWDSLYVDPYECRDTACNTYPDAAECGTHNCGEVPDIGWQANASYCGTEQGNPYQCNPYQCGWGTCWNTCYEAVPIECYTGFSQCANTCAHDICTDTCYNNMSVRKDKIYEVVDPDSRDFGHEWHHVAASFGNGFLHLFVNGEEVSELNIETHHNSPWVGSDNYDDYPETQNPEYPANSVTWIKPSLHSTIVGKNLDWTLISDCDYYADEATCGTQNCSDAPDAGYGPSMEICGTQNCTDNPDSEWAFDSDECGYQTCANNCSLYSGYNNQDALIYVNDQLAGAGICSEFHYDISNTDTGRSYYYDNTQGYMCEAGCNTEYRLCPLSCFTEYSQCANTCAHSTCEVIPTVNTFVGLLDEVRIWNKTQLEEDVYNHMNFTLVAPSEEGLVSYYKFNEGSGITGASYRSGAPDAYLNNQISWVAVPRPSTFEVFAEDGESLTSIRIEWEDATGINTGFKIYRNGNIYTTVPLAAADSYTNEWPAAVVGYYYNYCITALNDYAESDALCDVGFIDQTGSISGTIETESGQPVEHVKVTSIPSFGASGSFDGIDDYVDLTKFISQYDPDFENNGDFDLGSDDFTFEAWIKSDASDSRNAIFSIINTETNKGLYLYTNSNNQVQMDFTGTTGAHSDFNGMWDISEEFTDLQAVEYINNLGYWVAAEEFIDSNGNGTWDAPETYTDWNYNQSWDDDVETYVDANFNGVWDQPEPFIDSDGNGTWTDAEPLTDANQNGFLDEGEEYTDSNGNGEWDAPEEFTDLNFNGEWDGPEQFSDYNGDGIYEANIAEPFVDDNNDGIWFNGEFLYDMNNNYTWDDAEPWVEENDDVADGTWHHVAAVLSGGSLQMYVDGTASGSPVVLTGLNISANKIYVGNDHLNNVFTGQLDEIRFWNAARSPEQISQFWDIAVIPEQEEDLKGYWKFDANVFVTVYDRTLNNNHGKMKRGVGWNEDIAPVNSGDYTDEFGNYTIAGIVYNAAGTQFTVTPELGVHVFDPPFRLRTLNAENNLAEQVDFTDTSTYPVAGTINYVGTDCFAADVFIQVDGQFQAGNTQTNQFGQFSFDVPIGVHNLSPFSGTGDYRPGYYPYCFDANPELSDCPAHNFNSPVTNIQWFDFTKNKLTVDAWGGGCRNSLGSVAVRIRSTDPSTCYDEIHYTDKTGHLEVLLPPIHYLVGVTLEDYPFVTPDNGYTNFNTVLVNLMAGDSDLQYVYQADPNLEVSNLPGGCMGEDDLGESYEIPIFYQYMPDTLSLSLFEKYGYYEGETYIKYANAPAETLDLATCPVDSANIAVIDQLSDMSAQQDLPITDGAGIYAVAPGNPNILAGGAHPYQKKIEFTASSAGLGSDSYTVWAYVDGNKSRNVAFATTGPDIPLLILRDPPGDGSNAVYSEGSSSCFAMSMSMGASFGLNVGASVEMGPDFEAGFGMIVATDITAEVNVGVGLSIEGSVGTELNMCTEVTETYSTSGNDDIIGHTGDIFVGGALNVLYGITDNLYIFSADTLDTNNGDEFGAGEHMQPAPNEEVVDYSIIHNGACVIQSDRGLFVAPDGFATTYIFTEEYIITYMIPQLEFLAANIDEVEPGEPFTDANGNDSWEQGENYIDLNQNNQFDADYISDIHDYNRDIEKWNSHVNYNNYLKDAAEFQENISFSAGADYEYSFTGSRTETVTTEFSMSIENSIGLEVGATVAGIGAGVSTEMSFGISMGMGSTFENTETTSMSFVLSDDDIGDAFTVDIMEDPVYGTTVFKLISAVTSNPYEKEHKVDITYPDGNVHGDVVLSAATVPRDVPVFSVESNNVLLDVLPEDPAVYNLLIGNASQTPPDGETRTYTLSINQASNPDGAVIKIGGVNLEGSLAYTIAPFENINSTMTIDRGPIAYNYDDIELTFQAIDDGSQSVSQFVTAHFVSPCSPISLLTLSDNWVINHENNNELNIYVSNYDLDDINLRELGIQFREIGTNNWIPATSVSIDSVSSDEDYATILWDVSGIADSAYELRALAQCELNQSYTPAVVGVVDRNIPQIIGSPQPADGVLEPSDLISVSFSEDLNCNAINPPLHIHLDDLENALTVPYTFTCVENEIVIMPAMPDQFMENRQLTAKLVDIEDKYGNKIADDLIWEFFFNKNPVRWITANVNAVKIPEVPLSFVASIWNSGGQFETWELTEMPDWLTADVTSGELTFNESATITFDVSNNLNPGFHNFDVIAATPGGNEDLHVNIRMLCPDPGWEVEASQYQYTMTVTAVLYIQDELSTDSYDRVSAYVDNELRGSAPVVTYEDVNINGNIVDLHLVFLTIYSNQLSGEDITFRVWDSSECTEYGHVEEHFEFVNNAEHGLPIEPVTLTTTGAIVQRYDLPSGWTWLSMNLTPDDFSVNSVLNSLSSTPGQDIIKSQSTYSQFIEGLGWVGSLSELDNESMYLLRTAEADQLELVGEAVNPDSLDINVVEGWNWIGYSPQGNLTTNSALVSLDKVTGDLVKSQFGFAQYVEGAGWLGSLTYMTPQLGYLLRVSESSTLTYPAVNDDENPTLSKSYYFPAYSENIPVVDVAVKSYTYNMTAIFDIEKGLGEFINDYDILYAYVGDEIRGEAVSIPVDYKQQNLIFMMMYSDFEEGEVIHFELYDSEHDEMMRISDRIIFSTNQTLGTVDNPILLSGKGYSVVIPESFNLSQNFPNPFNPITEIQYSIPVDSKVVLNVYDISGRLVKTLISNYQSAGYHSVKWDGSNESGIMSSSGIYFYRMTTGEYTEMRKMILLK